MVSPVIKAHVERARAYVTMVGLDPRSKPAAVVWVVFEKFLIIRATATVSRIERAIRATRTELEPTYKDYDDTPLLFIEEGISIARTALRRTYE